MIRKQLYGVTLVCFGLALVDASAMAQSSAPVVARLEMKLTLNKEVIDVIEKGDLLTVLSERDKSYVIQTFNGQKGAVAKVNAVKLEESVPIYDELIAENEEEGRLYTLRASAHWAVGESEKALADYDKAIELGYDLSHAYASRGLFHAAIGNHDKAIEDYTTAIEKDAKDEVPLLNRAGVFMATGAYEKAVEDYTAAAKLQPDNPVLYTQRAIAHKMVGDLEKAIADYDTSLELSDQDVSAWMGRGFLHFQLANHEKAISDFTQVIEISPQTAVAFNNRGFNYQLLGKHAEAAADFQKAVELAPRYLLALQNKAWLLTICEDEKLRDPNTAIETAKAVCEVSQYKDVSDLTLLAAAYASAEEFETAIGWQEKAVELAKDEQKTISERILERYQNQLPLDPKLLEAQDEESPTPPATTPAGADQ